MQVILCSFGIKKNAWLEAMLSMASLFRIGLTCLAQLIALWKVNCTMQVGKMLQQMKLENGIDVKVNRIEMQAKS